MARPLFSTNLFAQQGLAGTGQIIVPAGFVVVVRDVDVYHGSELFPRSFFFRGHLGQAIDFWRTGVTTNEVHQWRGRQVMPGPCTFTVFTDAAMDVTVSGYLLTQ